MLETLADYSAEIVRCTHIQAAEADRIHSSAISLAFLKIPQLRDIHGAGGELVAAIAGEERGVAIARQNPNPLWQD